MKKEHHFNIVSNKYIPLRDVVFQTLRQAIITGEFEPGERLMEVSLSESLGVSRTPVREAIRKLELEGLVVMVPRKGAHVSKITEKNLQEVLEIRTVLEEFAVVLASERISPKGLEELTARHKAFVDSVQSEDLMTIAQKDEEFHDAIFRATDNARLLSIINNLREQFYRYRLEYLKDIHKRSVLIEEHERLCRAISSGDSKKARRIMKEHLDNQQKSILETLHLEDILSGS